MSLMRAVDISTRLRLRHGDTPHPDLSTYTLWDSLTSQRPMLTVKTQMRSVKVGSSCCLLACSDALIWGGGAPTLLPLLLWNHRACLLDRPSPDGGLLQSRGAAHHGAWTRVSRSHWTRRPTFGKAFSKGNSSDQRVGVSGVEILFILPQRWKRKTA